jgi:hypothetical protein
METIKICVDVNVNLSETTLNVFRNLLSGTSCNDQCSCKANTITEGTPINEPTCNKAVTEKSVEKSESVQQEKPAEKPAQPQATTVQPERPAQAVTLDIDTVRTALTKKVTAHRDAIKNKLNSLGAPSVTKLDPNKYQEMYDFLMSLD